MIRKFSEQFGEALSSNFILRHWKLSLFVLGMVVYGVFSRYLELPTYAEQTERALSEYPWVAVVIAVFALVWVSERAGKIGYKSLKGRK